MLFGRKTRENKVIDSFYFRWPLVSIGPMKVDNSVASQEEKFRNPQMTNPTLWGSHTGAWLISLKWFTLTSGHDSMYSATLHATMEHVERYRNQVPSTRISPNKIKATYDPRRPFRFLLRQRASSGRLRLLSMIGYLGMLKMFSLVTIICDLSRRPGKGD